MFQKEHLITWVTTTVFMYCIFWLIAWISNILDKKLPWHGRTLERAAAQIGLGIVLMSYVSLKSVYFLYERIFGIDLHQTEYVERDFVVVCTCIFAVNMLFLLFYLLIRDEKRTIEAEPLIEIDPQQQAEIEEKNRLLQQILDQECSIRYKVVGEYRVLQALEIAAFFIDSKETLPRFIQAILWDGSSKPIEELATLKSVVEPYSNLFVQVNRNYVVNRYAFESVTMADQATKCDLYVRIPNIEKLEANSSLYPMISDVLEQLKASKS